MVRVYQKSMLTTHVNRHTGLHNPCDASLLVYDLCLWYGQLSQSNAGRIILVQFSVRR